MLKYFKDSYSDGRSPIDTGLLASILQESLKLSGKVEVSKEVCYGVISLLFSGINYYFYLHPEQYIDFGKFVAYRNIDLKNLLVVEAKEPENANSIYEYYKNGGIQIDILKGLIDDYALNLFLNSIKDEEKAKEDIEKLKGLTSHSKTGDYNNKENENGI